MQNVDTVDVNRVVSQLSRFGFTDNNNFQDGNMRQSIRQGPYYQNGMSLSHDSTLYRQAEAMDEMPPIPFERRESRQGFYNTFGPEASSYREMNNHHDSARASSSGYHQNGAPFPANNLLAEEYPNKQYSNNQPAHNSRSQQQQHSLPLLENYGYGEVSESIRRREAQTNRRRLPPAPAEQRREHLDNYYDDPRNRHKSLPIPTNHHERSKSQPPSNFQRGDKRRKSFAKSMVKSLKKIFGGGSSKEKELVRQNSQKYVHREPPAPALIKQETQDMNWRDGRPAINASHTSLHEIARQDPRNQTLRKKHSTPSLINDSKLEDADSGVDSPIDIYRNMPTPLQHGLPNLGNTCYMNAVVQALAASESLSLFFMKDLHTKALQDRTSQQEQNSRLHGSNGAVTKALATLVNKLYANKCGEQDIRDFRAIVGDYSAEYRSLNQQDAQEFLSWLLDKVHEDLNMAKRDSNYNFARTGADMSPDDALAERRLNHYSVITHLFEGQLRSSIMCNGCDFQKFNFDPYMYVSLPIPHDLKRPLYVTVVKPGIYRLNRYGIRVDVKGAISDVKTCLSDETKIPLQQMLILQTSPSGFRSNVSDTSQISALNGKEAFALELPTNLNDYTQQTLNIVFVFAVRYPTSLSRETDPFIVNVSRQWSYESISRKLFDAGKACLNPSIVDSPPIGQFKLGLIDDYNHGVYLDPNVAMPLITPQVEQCISHNESFHRLLPKFIRLIVEFPTSLSRNIIPDIERRTSNHKSADCLTRENLQQEVSLQSCINAFTAEESCDWRCERCDRVGAKKQLKFNTLPQILILHLKRFRHDSTEPLKIDVPVNFPLEGLDMSQFIAQSPNTRRNSMLTRKFNRDLHESNEENIYDLFAVVNHKGDRVSSGHYTATIRNPADDQWRTFDDTMVSQNSDPRDQAANTYLMFYEKRSAREKRQNSRRADDGWLSRFPTNALARVGASRENATLPSLNTLPPAPRQNGNFRRGDAARRAANPASAAAAAAKAGLMLPLQTSKTHQIVNRKETELWN